MKALVKMTGSQIGLALITLILGVVMTSDAVTLTDDGFYKIPFNVLGAKSTEVQRGEIEREKSSDDFVNSVPSKKAKAKGRPSFPKYDPNQMPFNGLGVTAKKLEVGSTTTNDVSEQYLYVPSGHLCIMTYDELLNECRCSESSPKLNQNYRGKMVAIVPKNTWVAETKWRRRTLPKGADAAIVVDEAAAMEKKLFGPVIVTWKKRKWVLPLRQILGKIEPSRHLERTADLRFKLRVVCKNPKVVRELDQSLPLPLQPQTDLPMVYDLMVPNRSTSKKLLSVGGITPNDKGVAVEVEPSKKKGGKPFVVRFVKLKPLSMKPNTVFVFKVYPSNRERFDILPDKSKLEVEDTPLKWSDPVYEGPLPVSNREFDATRLPGDSVVDASPQSETTTKPKTASPVSPPLQRSMASRPKTFKKTWLTENLWNNVDGPVAEGVDKLTNDKLWNAIPLAAWRVADDWPVIAGKLQKIGIRKVVFRFEKALVAFPGFDDGTHSHTLYRGAVYLTPSKDLLHFAKAMESVGIEVWILSASHTRFSRGVEVAKGFPRMTPVKLVKDADGKKEEEKLGWIEFHHPTKIVPSQTLTDVAPDQQPPTSMLVRQAIDNIAKFSETVPGKLPTFNVMSDVSTELQEIVASLNQISAIHDHVKASQVLLFSAVRGEVVAARENSFNAIYMSQKFTRTSIEE